MYCGRESVSLSTVSCQLGGRVVFIPLQYELCTLYMFMVYPCPPLAVWTCRVYSSTFKTACKCRVYPPLYHHQSGCDGEGVSLSAVNSVDMSMNSFPTACRVYLQYLVRQQCAMQCGHARCITLHCQQCGLWWIFSIFVQFFFQMPECRTVPWYQNEKHVQYWNTPILDWNARCQKVDADAQLCLFLTNILKH